MIPMRVPSSSVASPAEPCSPARAVQAGGLRRGLASATFFGLLLVGLLAGCSGGGSGGSGAQPTNAQAGIVVTTITDASVPVIAVAADKNWKERITLVGSKDAAGTPISLTEIVYSTLGQDIEIALSAEGLPSVLSDQAGNKVAFTNWTSSSADVTFFDQEGGAVVGPTTIPIDPATIAALKNFASNTFTLQGQVAAGVLLAITKNDVRIWWPFVSDVLSASLCLGGLAAAIPSGGATFALAAGSCALTAGLIAGIADPGLETIESQVSIVDSLDVASLNGLGAFLTAGNLAAILLDHVVIPVTDALPPAKPTWFGPGIVASHDHVLLVWRGSESDSGIQGYVITRDDNKTFEDSSGTYSDPAVTPGLRYCYQVQAHKAPNSLFRWSAKSDPRCATIPMSAPPLVIVSKATNITPSSVALNGSVNPNGTVTSANFEYGTSAAYGNTTLAQAVGNGTSLINLIENLSNLVPNTTYRGGSGNSDSVVSGSLASPKPPGGGEPEEQGHEANTTESRSDI